MAMRFIITLSLICVSATWILLGDTKHAEADSEQRSACDSDAFLATAIEVERLRGSHRLTAAEFAKAAADSGTIVLDARGSEFYRQLHVKDSVNLPFTHFSAFALAERIPDQSSRILIYCRNNLANAPESFPVTPTSPPATPANIEAVREFLYPEEYDPPEIPKSAPAGLNIPTFLTLYSYGYKNVWELNDVVDPHDSEIEFEGEAMRRPEGAAPNP